jgi:antitoxin CcdA
MRNHTTDTHKRPVNLSINAHTLDQAKKLGINLSKTVDAFLQEEVKRRYWEQWREENQQAFAAYNERVAKDGLWATQHRSFGKSVGDGREE